MIYDANRISIEDDTDIALAEDVARALRGLRLARADRRLDPRRRRTYAEDVPALYDAIRRPPTRSPTGRSFIVLRTIIAWPAPNAQNTGKAHGSALGDEEVAATKEVLGFDPAQTFEVARERPRAHPRAAWRGARPRRPPGTRSSTHWAANAVGRTSPSSTGCRPGPCPTAGPTTLPTFDADPKGVATRKASGNGHQRDRRRCCRSSGAARPTWPSPTTPPSRARRRSCRPTARTKMWQGDPYAGRVLHFGIREHGMGAIMNGIAAARRHPRLRRHLPHLLRLHARRRCGWPRSWGCRSPTSGPTTRSASARTARPTSRSSTCAALRAIPGLDVVRPADANETAACWQTILEHTDRPAGLALTRQNVPVFPRGEDGFSDTVQRAPRRLRAARHRRRPRRGPGRHRLRGPARGRGAEDAGRGRRCGPCGLDAVPRVVRRPGRRPTARPSSRRP